MSVTSIMAFNAGWKERMQETGVSPERDSGRGDRRWNEGQKNGIQPRRQRKAISGKRRLRPPSLKM